MVIYNQILSFNSVTGSILVRYFTDDNKYELLTNIDVPLENGVFVSNEEVLKLIEIYKPTGQLTRMQDLETIEIPAYLSNYIVPEVAVVPPPSAVETPAVSPTING